MGSPISPNFVSDDLSLRLCPSVQKINVIEQFAVFPERVLDDEMATTDCN